MEIQNSTIDPDDESIGEGAPSIYGVTSKGAAAPNRSSMGVMATGGIRTLHVQAQTGVEAEVVEAEEGLQSSTPEVSNPLAADFATPAGRSAVGADEHATVHVEGRATGRTENQQIVEGTSHCTCQAATESAISLIKRKRGKPARKGPDYREAPLEESAISAALRTAPSRQGEAIFYPYIGTTFNSCEEAKEFYNLYSWEKGFGVRYGRSKSNDNNYRTRMDLVCSCEGLNSNPNSASLRTDCKAKIRLLRRKDHAWYISEIVDIHNHRLTPSYGENKQWPSHSTIDPATKDFVRKLRENNVSLGRVCNILGVSDRENPSSIRKETIRSLCAKLSRENLKDDLAKTMQLLEDMKKSDPGLEVRYRLNSSGRLKSMIWSTGRNRLDYAKFGDAITFDTTYRTNLYSLPFGLFVGVNNHFQSIIFGGVLLTTEKTDDFIWAFTTFVEIMGGKAPVTMLTDQCSAMAKAIRLCMKHTRHRWCRWHVLKDAKEKLGNTYSKKKKFKSEFHKLITDETNKIKFEETWGALIKKYQLTKSKYLQRLFKHRAMWAKPYFMGIFCAGMTSTQRSESANHMLKRLIQKAAPMHMFVSKFNEFQYDRQEQESKQEFATNQVSRKLKVGVPIEEHANEIYTRAMYEKFYDELFEAGKFAIERKLKDSEYILVFANKRSDPNSPRIRVWMEGKDKILCECGLYEHIGMLCRHALKVLMHLDITEIPRRNIHLRWTKSISPERNHETSVYNNEVIQNNEMMKKLLLSKAFELANKNTKIPEHTFIQAMEAMENIQKSSKSSTTATDKKSTDVKPIALPERTILGGRPPNSGLKAWLACNKRSSLKRSRADAEAADWPEEENPPTNKKKSLAALLK